MGKIAVLDQQTIDKIAAGEVVERPASVVKELVENAIDAGATQITVEIKEGGIGYIRITDNGSGMEKDDIPVAFLRHSTSKIRSADDLLGVSSLGFRGEALSSISAVAMVELITKTKENDLGSRCCIEGGVQKSLEEIGAPDGTTFIIRNLFYNTPARKKFLKSEMSEASAIHELMTHLAMSHPEVGFKVLIGGQMRIQTSGNGNLKDVIYHLYGRDVAMRLIEVDREEGPLHVRGFLGKPEISRGNRTFENYYINGRFVKNRIIAKGIEDAYKGFLMQHKFPFVSLHIQMEGNDLDVNVHPSKMEVRFARGTEVYDAVYETVHKALTTREIIQTVPFGKEEPIKKQQPVVKPGDVPEPFETRRRAEIPEYRPQTVNTASRVSEHTALPRGTVTMAEQAVREQQIYQTRDPLTKAEEQLFEGTLSDKKNEEQPVFSETKQEIAEQKTAEYLKTAVDSEGNRKQIEQNKNVISEEIRPQQLELFEEKLLAPESRSRHQLIGQIFDTYWLVQFEDKFFIIDQHAAHEKVYYERFVKRFREQTVESQYLSPPLIVSLNLQEEALLKANRKYFEDFGFEIEPFGGKEYCINAVPANLYGLTEEELFLEMLDNLASEKDKDPLGIFASRLATMACKAAVKGNNQMSDREANALIDELLTLENPYHCPHGRPTIISMTKTELEKKFKRIV